MEFLGISITDWVGYAAMATVLISFLMTSVNKLRIVNSAGVYYSCFMALC
ncbi:hypothetical protein [Algibacter lectus]|uniref:Uncharacterized protein n=1 Tax=Algibacter lectus TaxID=221126 RepID=A0A090W9G1_9FLAO|nr:hypothetical protein JCM19300_2310 [Algibacter lectus]